MAQNYTNDHFPVLENFHDKYVYQYYMPTKSVRFKRLTRSDRNADLESCMEMIALLLIKHQSQYKQASDNKWELWFPYLQITPGAGDKIKNTSTGEIYTVLRILRDSATKQFYGHILLQEGTTPPNPDLGECLEFLSDSNYIKFLEEASPIEIGNVEETSEGHLSHTPGIKPTISYSVVREEPGSYGGNFFSNVRKELKPRVREQFPDPVYRGYQVEILGQIVDSLVQFDCWANEPREARRLVSYFKEFMRSSSWILGKNGINELIWWASLGDKNDSKMGQTSHSRSVQYALRTEILEARRIAELRNINIAANLSNVRVVEPETKEIADFKYQGPLTQKVYRSLFFDQSGNYRYGDNYYNDDGGSAFD